MKWTIIGAFAFATFTTLSPAQSQHEHDAGPPANGPYSLRLGDLMILQQIRHAKLWFAVAANNWPLAGHELSGLRDGFEDVARLYPTIHGVPVAPVVGALSGGQLAEIAKAIGGQDRVKFVAAFDQLTAACNTCHQSTEHGFIVIQQPISPPFNNQSFAPTGPGAPSGAPMHDHPR